MQIFASISAVMAEIGPISKDRKNTQQGYAFRGVDDAMNALNPLMAKYKIFPMVHTSVPVLWEEVKNKNGNIGYHTIRLYTLRLYAEDGSFVEGQMEGQAIDYGDKSITKAQSVAYREFLYKTFVVPLESNEDIEQTSHTLVKKEPARALEPIKPYFGKIQFEALSNDVKSGFVNFENVIETKKSIMKEYIVPTEWAEALKMLFEDMTPKNESVIEKVDPVEKVKEDIAKIASKKNQEEVPVEDIDF